MTPSFGSHFIVAQHWAAFTIIFIGLITNLWFAALFSVLACLLNLVVIETNQVFGHSLGTSESDAEIQQSYLVSIVLAEIATAAFLTVFRGAYERRRDELAEIRMNRAEDSRKADLEEAVGNFAHEVNNPLAIVHASLLHYRYELSRKGSSEARRRFLLRALSDALFRIQTVITNLHTFAEGDGREEKKMHKVQELLAELKEQMKIKGRGGKVLIRPFPQELFLFCRFHQILYVLVALLDNAFDAVQNMKGRGLITVQLLRKGPVLRFQVEDKGCGISVDIVNRIFQPFVSSKGAGKSMGMSLSVCRGIIEEHGGKIGFVQKNKGVIFWFELMVQGSSAGS